MDNPAPLDTSCRTPKHLLGRLIYALWLVYLVLALRGFYGVRPSEWHYWTLMLLLVLFVIVSRRLAKAYLSRRR